MFIDTHLWSYRLDRREPEKSAFVRNWLREFAGEHEAVISTQVLIELRFVVTGKRKPSLSWRDMLATMEALADLEVLLANTNLVLDAHQLSRAEQLCWFDPLIVEAASHRLRTPIFPRLRTRPTH